MESKEIRNVRRKRSTQDQDPWLELSGEKKKKNPHTKLSFCFILSLFVVHISLLMEKPTVPELIFLLSSHES